MKSNLLLLLLILSLFNCAQQSRPSGGEGDITPPIFVKVKPDNEATNVPTDSKVKISFSEWVEPTSAIKAVAISPSFSGELKFDVRGRDIILRPTEGWNENTTYHITVTGDIQDYYKNNLKEGINIVFSTGNELDSAEIKGAVALENDTIKSPIKVALFFKERVDTALDTIFFSKPDYLTQVDSLGNFVFSNIHNGDYALFAFSDQDRNNQLSNKELSYIRSTIFTSTESSDSIILWKAICDTTKLLLSKPTVVTPNMLLITQNSTYRDIDSILLLEKKDSTFVKSNSSSNISSLHNPKTLLVSFSDSIKNSQYILKYFYRNPISSGVHFQNKKDDTLFYNRELYDSLTFNAIIPQDTVQPVIKGIKVLKSNSLSPKVLLSFDRLVQVNSTLIIQDTLGKKFIYSTKRTIDSNFIYKSEKLLDYTTNYSIAIDSNFYRSLNGLKGQDDTTFLFKTAEPKNIALSISLLNDSCKEYNNWNWELYNSVDTIPFNNTLIAQKVPAGKYTIRLFNDKNNNGKRDLGTIFPFRFGEEAIYINDTIKSVGRWEIEKVMNIPCCLTKQKKIIVSDTITDSLDNNNQLDSEKK